LLLLTLRTLQVAANDRAPARHTDATRGRAQRTARVSLEEYLAYYLRRATERRDDDDEEEEEEEEEEDASPPFYMNGWRAMSQHPVRQRRPQRRRCKC
jgi:hypothetical protein